VFVCSGTNESITSKFSGLVPGCLGDGFRCKKFPGEGEKNYFCVLWALVAKCAAWLHWALWLLEHDDRVARVCGLQLACRQLADRQQPEWGMETCKWRMAGNHRICDTRQGWALLLVLQVGRKT